MWGEFQQKKEDIANMLTQVSEAHGMFLLHHCITG